MNQLQSLPLDAKILMTEQRIREWYDYFNGDVCVSFSGGKDSTVLAHIVHSMYPDVPLVFADTGLEYPEIRKFASRMGAEFVRPKMMFVDVITKYGYPLISKEVAEAIHFARRIIPQNAGSLETLERERERESVLRTETERTGRDEGRYRDHQMESIRRRTQIKGQQNDISSAHTERPHGAAEWRRANLTNSLPESKKEQNGTPRYKAARTLAESTDVSSGPDGSSWAKTDWNEWRRKSIAGVDEGYVGNSQFNKKKWLPLCHETQFMISHYCCNVMKKGPMGIYQRKTGQKPYLGTMAEESRLRAQAWIRHGCNAFDMKKQTSQPMSFWTEQDVLEYIRREGLEIASVYGEILGYDDSGMFYDPLPGVQCNLKCTGCQRTGCMFCGFGCHLERGETRFQLLAMTHPKQYEYCMGGGQWVDNPNYEPAAPEYDGNWKNWNPKKIWVPSKKGLGMRKVFQDCNEIYGKDFIRFE